MREAARLLLDGSIGRREFLSRFAALGVTGASATKLARSLGRATSPATPDDSSGRILENLTGGEVMAELLLDWKIPYVFGLGGSEEVGFLDALVDRIGLQYVQGLHEGSIMSMADGYARASGTTPLVNLHSVAGTGYAFGPMVNAFKDRIPIVVTVGRQATDARGTNAFLEAENLHNVPKDFTQWTWDVLNPETVPDTLRRAFLLASVPPGGPTFVTFSKDMWEATIPRAEILPRSRSGLDLDIAPSEEAVKRSVDLLLDAAFPVIAVGKEVNRFGGTDEVMKIAEMLGAPVFKEIYSAHSPMSFPSTHPHYAGMFTEDPHFPESFDLYWSVGGTMFSLFGHAPKPIVPRQAKVIHTGLDASEIGRSYPVDVPMMANPRVAAAAIAAELEKRALRGAAVEERKRVVVAYHQTRRQRLDAVAAEKWSASPISIERLLVEINRALEPDAIAVTELVTAEYFLPAYFDIDHTRSEGDRRRNLTTSGGVLGWGLPAAVGAKIARPDKQVLALVGDGSFQFGVQALWTAARFEVPVGIVIWNNGQYQANRRFLHAYGKRAAATGKYIGCNLGSPDIDHVAIARGYGVEGERIQDPDLLKPAIDRCLRALEEGRPYVLDVKVEKIYGGADSEWYDSFSIARNQPRTS
jgi:thiamine pyrophosphate-dependent acetolactate synthase large subunit-like protein